MELMAIKEHGIGGDFEDTSVDTFLLGSRSCFPYFGDEKQHYPKGLALRCIKHDYQAQQLDGALCRPE